MSPNRAATLVALVCAVLAFAGFTIADRPDRPAPSSAECEDDNAGLTLPDGFCATVFADGLGRVRHILVDPHGIVFDATCSSTCVLAYSTASAGNCDASLRAFSMFAMWVCSVVLEFLNSVPMMGRHVGLRLRGSACMVVVVSL